MKPNVLYIKNMVCPRCLWAVEGILNKLQIGYKKVEMGEVITT
jgi:glutaredoxin-related protein